MGYAIIFGLLVLCGVIEGLTKPSYKIYSGKMPKNKAHDHYVFFIDR